MVVAARRNSSSRTLSRPVGAPLRHQRRVRGGGPPAVEVLFSSSLPAGHLPNWEVSLLAFGLKEGAAALGILERWESGASSTVHWWPTSLYPGSSKLGAHP